MMVNESVLEIKAYIEKHLEEGVRSLCVEKGELCLTVKVENLESVLIFLRNSCKFLQLSDICGVDYPDRDDRFEVVYHLLNMYKNLRIRVKISVEEHVEVPSVCRLFKAANWFEREVFDMYGIPFKNHPDLRRILTAYEFQGYPLRKDFPAYGEVEVFYNEAERTVVYEPVRLNQRYRKYQFEGPWSAPVYEIGDDKDG